MVLYSVVGASSKDVCDVCPLIPDLTMKDEKHPFLFFWPLKLLIDWVKMIVPPLSALFANSSFKFLSDLSPLLGSSLLHEHEDFSVFFFCPRSFDKTWVQYFLPSVQTLDIGSARKIFCDFFPVPLVVLFNCIKENVVFFLSPVALGWAVLVFRRTKLVKIRVFLNSTINCLNTLNTRKNTYLVLLVKFEKFLLKSFSGLSETRWLQHRAWLMSSFSQNTHLLAWIVAFGVRRLITVWFALIGWFKVLSRHLIIATVHIIISGNIDVKLFSAFRVRRLFYRWLIIVG